MYMKCAPSTLQMGGAALPICDASASTGSVGGKLADEQPNCIISLFKYNIIHSVFDLYNPR